MSSCSQLANTEVPDPVTLVRIALSARVYEGSAARWRRIDPLQ